MPVKIERVAPCQQVIEVFAPTGESCGSVAFKFDDQSCFTGPISIGYDGSVFQIVPPDQFHTPPRTNLVCVWRSWPAYFR